MESDFAALGLKAGLEVHQQIDTKHKLFCKCPTTIRDDKADVIVRRRLRASAGETGEMDVAAAYEQVRGKSYLYSAYNDTVCNVELDEEPIHNPNEEALAVCLQVSMMLGAKPVDRILVMRKTVVDGSNTSGFQRTALVARNGKLKGKNIIIQTICLEEESAKIVERTGSEDIYNLSRLGIPLVEIATGADMHSPGEVKDAAEYIGMVLRSTGRVKRGLGTIRQDVNVSISKGARVEIKGAQNLHMLPILVKYEALRQAGLCEIAEELRARRAEAGGKLTDITSLLQNCQSKLLMSVISEGGVILAARLKGFHGLLGKELLPVPGGRLGRELSEYAKAFTGAGIMHGDELPKFGITSEEVHQTRKVLDCGPGDSFVIVAAGREKAEKGIKAVFERAAQAIKGVQAEVRKANDDGTTSFLRPMPGSARMYPETDTPMINPGSVLEKIKLPRLLTERAAGYQKTGLDMDMAKAIAYSEHAFLFEEMASKCKKISPSYIADIILSYNKQVGAESEKITEEMLAEAIMAVEQEKLAKESVISALFDAAKTGKLLLEKFRVMSDGELEKELAEIIAANKNMPLNALTGKAMEKLRGKAPGQKIVEKLKRLHDNL